MASRPELVSSVPPCLQPIKKYLARAEELSRQSSPDGTFPKIACLTRMAATEMGITLLKGLSSGEQAAAGDFLGGLMTACESDKASLGMVKESEATDVDLVRLYALSVFKAADDGDRAGATDVSTSRRFIVAGLLLDVHKQLCGGAGVPLQLEQMGKYAKARGMDIKSCLESGREPPPAGSFSSADEGGSAPMELVGSSLSAPPTASAGYAPIPTADVYHGSGMDAAGGGIPTAVPVATPYAGPAGAPVYNALPYASGAASSAVYPVPVPVARSPHPAPAPVPASSPATRAPLPAYSPPPASILPAMPPQYSTIVELINAGLGDMHLGKESKGADAFRSALKELEKSVSSLSFTAAMGAMRSALSMRDAHMTNARVLDAAEHARFAIASLRYCQPELAVNNLREALAELGQAA